MNLDDWDQGFIDSGLTPLGQQQAASLGRWLAQNTQLEALYASTMARALETAVFVTKETGLPALGDDRLREFGNCYPDGRPIPAAVMPIQYAEFWGTERPYTQIGEEGESWLLFRARVGTFMDDMVTRHGASVPETTVAVICHGGVIDAMTDYIYNIGAYRRVEILIHNTGIMHWEYRPDSQREIWRLHAHGLVHHLFDVEGQWLGSKPILRGASRQSLPTVCALPPKEDA